MLDDYFKRDDVRLFIKQLKTNDCYYQKNHHFSTYPFSVSSELALYIFYDALLKFKIIIDTDSLFSEYLIQLEKLYRKLHDFDDLRFAIHKLIARMTASLYDIQDWKQDDREELLTILYNRYIENGYLFHGFSSSYKDSIKANGFVPEYYENYYNRFQQVNSIFRHKVIQKDFLSKAVSFCDDSVLGCYYSMCSPMYFFQFLTNSEILGKKIREDAYLKDDYSILISPLKRFMDNNLFRVRDKKNILSLVSDEWSILQKGDKEICLLCVPRKKVMKHDISLKQFLDSKQDIFEIVDRMLSSKYNNVLVSEAISSDVLEIVTCPHYYERKSLQVMRENRDKACLNEEFLNMYGNVSLLLIFGSLSISLGVIIMMIQILGG